MRITALYAGLLAVLFVLLSVHVIRRRLSNMVSLGDGGDAELSRRIRVHGNFAEYVPLGLILIGLSESLGAAPLLVHGLGLALLVGRLSHAWGLSPANKMQAFRTVGMVLTFGVLLVGAGVCLVGAF
jgi:uncharacterized membrane protein YecN with MAPEG domain